jgi:transcriptional regulator with XRE-family HTH domain
MTVYERIKQIRLERGFTQEYMAEKLGIRHNSYGKIERGITNLSLTRIQEISKIFDLDYTLLISDRVDSKNEEILNIKEINHLRREIELLQAKINFLVHWDFFNRNIVKRDLFLFELYQMKVRKQDSKYSYLIKDIPEVILRNSYSSWDEKLKEKYIDQKELDKAYHFWRFDNDDELVLTLLPAIISKKIKDPEDEALLLYHDQWKISQ